MFACRLRLHIGSQMDEALLFFVVVLNFSVLLCKAVVVEVAEWIVPLILSERSFSQGVLISTQILESEAHKVK